MSSGNISPRRHLVQALTLVNDILNRRRRDGLTLNEEEDELLKKVYANAPRATVSSDTSSAAAATNATATSVVAPPSPSDASSGNNAANADDNRKTTPTRRGNSPPGSSRFRDLIPTTTGGDETVATLVNFAVSCSSLVGAPVQLMQLLVEFVIKFVPEGKPVSMMIFDGDYTVDPMNGTLLANSDRFLNMFSEKSNDFVFDAAAAAYFLPVTAEGELFGFVQINNMHRADELPSERCKLLVASTSITALALRTAWQLEDLEWSHRKQALLLKIAGSLTNDAFSKEVDVIQRLVSKARDLGDAQAAYYFHVGEQDDSTITTNASTASANNSMTSVDNLPPANSPIATLPGGRVISYFRKGEFIPASHVFNTETTDNSDTERKSSGTNLNDSQKMSSPQVVGDFDDEEDSENAFSDAVRLAMQTAEHVAKSGNVVQLQQAAGDDNTYIDVVGTRNRYAGARTRATATSTSASTSAGAAGFSLSLRRRTGVAVDLPFSLVQTRSVRSVLGVPIINEENQVKGVIVLTNKNHRRVARIDVPQVFESRDTETMLALCSVASISLANCTAAGKLQTEKKKRDAILSVVGHLNECDIRNVSEICKYVMHGAKKLLNADRSTLFLIDEEHDELYSAVADSVGKVIRFAVGKGISGRVALTGLPEAIRDAYQDDRFNREVDKETGYRTLSILTVPVKSKGNVLAVAQLVNKLGPKGEAVAFCQSDLEVLRTFSLFAGIAISNSKLLEFTVKAGQEAMALTNFEAGEASPSFPLMRQSTSSSMALGESNQPIPPSEMQMCRDALEQLKKLIEKDSKYDPSQRDFDLFGLREEAPDSAVARDYASAVVVFLIQSAGYDRIFKIEEDVIISFVLQCRRVYRFVPYHNFFHAVDAVQTIYAFIFFGGGRNYISELESFVLLATALVHDLDHMGTNNNYHLKTDSPLGILSAVSGNNSVLEVHHCNEAIKILSGSDANIFASLSRTDSANAYRMMMSCVLATDMARHGELLNQFEGICGKAGAEFNKEEDNHRLVVMQMLMKAADISNVTKLFPVSRQWSVAVTEEFYQQGDKERAKGLAVLPMNDRQLGTELAKGQLGFINFVAMKFFTSMRDNLLKEFDWVVARVVSNKATWEEMLAVPTPAQ